MTLFKRSTVDFIAGLGQRLIGEKVARVNEWMGGRHGQVAEYGIFFP